MGYTYARLLTIVVIVVILSSLCTVLAKSGQSVPTTCRSYFVAISVLIKEPSRGLLEIDVPTNFSLGNIAQRSVLLKTVNLSTGFALNASKKGFHAALFKVRICYPRPSWMVNLLTLLMLDPYAFSNYSVPARVLKKFVGRPEPVILNVAKSFVSWLRKNGVEFPRLSVAGLAVEASVFVYYVYISYSPSPIPRSVEETVKLRKGDCDDMSRVLTELLWHFYIPAMMMYGFVELNFSRAFEIRIGNFSFVSPDLAPHAFVVAYLPPFGWLSIDLLAGSYITNPFIATALTMSTRVNETEAKNFVRMLESIRGTYLALAIPKNLVDEASRNLRLYPQYLAIAISRYVIHNAANASWSSLAKLLKFLSFSRNVYQKDLRLAVLRILGSCPIQSMEYEHVCVPR